MHYYNVADTLVKKLEKWGAQTELARRAGVEKSTITKLIKKTADPSDNIVAAIANPRCWDKKSDALDIVREALRDLLDASGHDKDAIRIDSITLHDDPEMQHAINTLLDHIADQPSLRKLIYSLRDIVAPPKQAARLVAETRATYPTSPEKITEAT